MAYATLLCHLRVCARRLGEVPAELSKTLTLHVKCTFTSWGSQLDAPLEQRASQGHHAVQGAGVVVKYSRDDTNGALRLQCRAVCGLAAGWRPWQPMLRGAAAPVPECRCDGMSFCRPGDNLLVMLAFVEPGPLPGVDTVKDQVMAEVESADELDASENEAEDHGKVSSDEEDSWPLCALSATPGPRQADGGSAIEVMDERDLPGKGEEWAAARGLFR